MKKSSLAAALLFIAAPVFAGGSHHSNTTNYYTEVNNYNIVQEFGILEDELDDYLGSLSRDVAGIAALSIAHGSLNFSSNTRKLQLGVGAGSYADQESLVMGIGKLYGSTLITGSIGRARGHTSGGLSITWTMD